MGLNKLKNFYKNKRIFITGHTGFKGIWIFLILKFLGAKVKGYALGKFSATSWRSHRKIFRSYTRSFVSIAIAGITLSGGFSTCLGWGG